MPPHSAAGASGQSAAAFGFISEQKRLAQKYLPFD